MLNDPYAPPLKRLVHDRRPQEFHQAINFPDFAKKALTKAFYHLASALLEQIPNIKIFSPLYDTEDQNISVNAYGHQSGKNRGYALHVTWEHQKNTHLIPRSSYTKPFEIVAQNLFHWTRFRGIFDTVPSSEDTVPMATTDGSVRPFPPRWLLGLACTNGMPLETHSPIIGGPSSDGHDPFYMFVDQVIERNKEPGGWHGLGLEFLQKHYATNDYSPVSERFGQLRAISSAAPDTLLKAFADVQKSGCGLYLSTAYPLMLVVLGMTEKALQPGFDLDLTKSVDAMLEMFLAHSL